MSHHHPMSTLHVVNLFPFTNASTTNLSLADNTNWQLAYLNNDVVPLTAVSLIVTFFTMYRAKYPLSCKVSSHLI